GYRPRILQGLTVWAERTVHVEPVIREGVPPFAEADTTQLPQPAARTRATVSQSLWDRGWRAAPHADRSLAQLLRTASHADPEALSRGGDGTIGLVVDGTPVGQGAGRAFGAGVLPLIALSTAELAAAPVDLELPGHRGGVLLLHMI